MSSDLALAYDAMQGLMPTTRPAPTRPVEPVAPLLTQDIGGLADRHRRRLFPEECVSPRRSRPSRRVAKALGATRTVEIPEAARARAAAYVITTTEGASLHLDRLRTAAG